MKRHRNTAALVILLTLSTACIHKSTGNVTPMERLTTDNALLAQINNTVEQGAEAVQSTGQLTVAQVTPVIAWTQQVAKAHLQITAIISKGSSVTVSDYTSIQGLIDQVEISGDTLIKSGVLGIKNPKSQQTISDDMAAIITLAKTVLSEVQQVSAAKSGGAL